MSAWRTGRRPVFRAVRRKAFENRIVETNVCRRHAAGDGKLAAYAPQISIGVRIPSENFLRSRPDVG
jgi:hypothetical protein